MRMPELQQWGMLLVSAFFFLSCAGEPVKPVSPHLSAGAEQIKKGNFFYGRGCYQRSLEHYLRAHELYCSSDQPGGVAMSLNNIGNAYRAMGDPRAAVPFFAEAVSIYEGTGDNAGLRQVLCNEAAALIGAGELGAAAAALEKASAVRVPGETGIFTPVLRNRGILLLRKKDYPAAEEVLRKALAEAAKAGLSEQASAHQALGNLLLETGRAGEAAAHFKSALDSDRENGYYRGIADDLYGLGQCHAVMGDYRAAAEYWKRSLHVYALLGFKDESSRAMERFKAAAAKASMETGLTEMFLKRWVEEGVRLEGPCDD